MNELNVILVGVDFTSGFRGAVEAAVRLAKARGATLLVRHVIDADRLGRYLKHQDRETEADVIASSERRLGEELGLLELDGVVVEPGVEVGVPGETLLAVADERKVELVVLSAHDRVKWGVGGVAAQVLRGAKGRVLLVRDWQKGKFRRVGVCVDFSELSLEAVRQGARVAKADGAALEVVNVIYPVAQDYYGNVFEVRGDASRPSSEEVKRRVRAEIEAFLAPVQDEIGTLELRLVVLESTNPSAAITGYFEQVNVDLAVLGTTGKRSFFGLRLGTNAERLVRDTGCSVLAVKGGSFKS